MSNGAGTNHYGSPYAFYVVVIALILVSAVFVTAMFAFRTTFDAATMTTTLGSLFTLVGTVVGAYFGIKVSGDTAAQARGARENAEVAKDAALAALPREDAEAVLRSVGQMQRASSS